MLQQYGLGFNNQFVSTNMMGFNQNANMFGFNFNFGLANPQPAFSYNNYNNNNFGNLTFLTNGFSNNNSFNPVANSYFTGVNLTRQQPAALPIVPMVNQPALPVQFTPPLPLNNYRVNYDPNPVVIVRKPDYVVNYNQNVGVRYLNPPPPPPAGPIFVQQLPDRQVAPAPPLVLRTLPLVQPAVQPAAPIVIREAPPKPPKPIPSKLITVPGRVLPPPNRQVILEELPPMPPKPPKIIFERWLPYKPQVQKVVYIPAKPTRVLPNPKNLVIKWDAPEVRVTKKYENLGVVEVNPEEYLKTFAGTVVKTENLPALAHLVSKIIGIPLAADSPNPPEPILVGDVEALKLIPK